MGGWGMPDTSNLQLQQATWLTRVQIAAAHHLVEQGACGGQVYAPVVAVAVGSSCRGFRRFGSPVANQQQLDLRAVYCHVLIHP